MLVHRLAASAVLATTVLATSGIAAPAHASARTVNEPFVIESGHLVDTTDCADPIDVDFTAHEVLHSHYDAAGTLTRVQITGQATNVYTNPLTHQVYAPQSNGSGVFYLPDLHGSAHGPNSIVDEQGRLLALRGHAIIDPDGLAVAFTGHVVDICRAVGSVPAAEAG
jgi:hypothetical protein